MASDSRILQAAREAGLEAEASEAIHEHQQKNAPSHANLRFYMAILGVLPWVGVLISASIARWSEAEQDKLNLLHRRWLEEHDARFKELEEITRRIVGQAERAGDKAKTRLNDDAFLPLVRQGFRVWDKSEDSEKRELVRKVLTNAACDSLCTDDFVRRFIEWIDSYNELHFRVIRCLYKSPESTRLEMWQDLHPGRVREDSAEADLFKLLIRDLSTGGVIRQFRPTDAYGNFAKKRPGRPNRTGVLKSAFDNEEPYVLTELGQKFVHYVFNEVVPKLPGHDDSNPLSGEPEPENA